ncbi:hypothetical protein D3C72_1748770 [compost metagenome]
MGFCKISPGLSYHFFRAAQFAICFVSQLRVHGFVHGANNSYWNSASNAQNSRYLIVSQYRRGVGTADALFELGFGFHAHGIDIAIGSVDSLL